MSKCKLNIKSEVEFIAATRISAGKKFLAGTRTFSGIFQRKIQHKLHDHFYEISHPFSEKLASE